MEGLFRLNPFIDLDGVLVDFNKGFMELCGSRIPMREYEDEEFAWELIKKTPDFWKQLLPMPGAISFWESLVPYRPCILTSPSTHDTKRAILQKREWVDKWLGKHVPVFFRRSKNKCELASPDALLIDDWEPNIQSWRANGGIAIHHISIENTKQQLALAAKLEDVHSFIRAG